MYKTPVNERKRKSVNDKNMKTPVEGLGTSLVEPSMLNTPEEPGKVCICWDFIEHKNCILHKTKLKAMANEIGIN